jgi:S1/P1 Nuclease
MTFLLIASFALVPPSAWGWGREGHQIAAAVAEDHLDETTKVMIQSLIGNNHLYSIATWADDIRKERRDTAPWHYVDIPLGSTYDVNRDCPPPNSCVVVKIAEFVKVLTNKQANRNDRAEALKFIVHFVGDIHQPMHAVGEAKGGNSIHVSFLESGRCGRYDCNLHGVWDSDLIGHTGLTREEYAPHEEELIGTGKLEALADGTPEQWANESLKFAEAAWVPDGTDLNERYYDKQIKVVDRQLALAGLRLAKLLNDSIGKMTPKDFAASVPPNAGQETSPASERAGETPNDRGSGVEVWVNTKSGAFHCPDSRWYGKTKRGEYMSESEAVKNGYHAAGGKFCPSSQ